MLLTQANIVTLVNGAAARTFLFESKWQRPFMKIHSIIVFSLLLFLADVTVQSQQSAVNKYAQAVDDHYNHLKSFKAAFTEIYQGDDISRTESGTLWLKKPSRMRWEYHVPREKLFLTDSQTAYFYVTGDRQAKIGRA